MRKYEEREDKFDVEPDWVMPQLTPLVPDGGRLDQDQRTLISTYFDTADAALRLFGVTLRRRIGGSDTGWQLKVPTGTSRTELQSGARTKTVPGALAEAVSGLLAGDAVAPVATVHTQRTAYRVLDADDQLVLEVADDQVESAVAGADLPARTWRQVEIEYGSATKKTIKTGPEAPAPGRCHPERQSEQAGPSARQHPVGARAGRVRRRRRHPGSSGRRLRRYSV